MAKQYWLHRISYVMDVSYPLLDEGYLSIGFSDFAEPDFIGSCQNKWEHFEKYFKKLWGSLPRNRYTLWRFIYKMNEGDRVLVPSWGKFHIFEIVHKKTYLPSEIIEIIDKVSSWDGISIKCFEDKKLHYQDKVGSLVDLGFFRKVRPVCKNIPRRQYADSALTSRMKARQTNVNITNIKESIEIALKSFQNKMPINLQSQIIDKSLDAVIKTIRESLNPDKFERLIQRYFLNIGADSADIPAKKEKDKLGDADIVSTFENLKTIFYIQAKFHQGTTDSFALDQIDEYVQYKNDSFDDGYTKVAWVITSAKKFTDECLKKGKALNIQLIDIQSFARMILESGISNLSEI